jgi:hypothetical protein
MNISYGGLGGIQNKDHYKKFMLAATNAFKEKLKDPEFKQKFSETCSNRNKKRIELGTIKSWKETCNWIGRNHRPETLQKMKNSKVNHGIGESNSQYGTCWITNDIENKKIKKTDSIPMGWKLGRK